MASRDEQLAYCAGYFDGEGSIILRFSKRGLWSLRVSLMTGDLACLEVFTENFGGDLTKDGRKDISHKNRQIWVWRRSGIDAQNFLREVLPFLRIKRNIAEKVMALEFQTGFRVKLSEEEHSKRLTIAKSVYAFNHRRTLDAN